MLALGSTKSTRPRYSLLLIKFAVMFPCSVRFLSLCAGLCCAVVLSPPGYYLRRGFGSGKDSWILYLEVRNRNLPIRTTHMLHCTATLQEYSTCHTTLLQYILCVSLCITVQGGGWCFSWEECYGRVGTILGSSEPLPEPLPAASKSCYQVRHYIQ